MHLGIIPDGNRRYARNHRMRKKKAYRKATEVIADLGKKFRDSEIEEVTFYLLSEENLERDEEELETLFELFRESIDELVEEFADNGFSVNWATTRPGAIPEELASKLRELEEKFDEGEKKVNLLISYSGKKDILEAAEELKRRGEDFTEENLGKALEITGSIDYVIRTGDNPDRECLSGFPIWNASYAEYYHIKKNFPGVTAEDVDDALEHFEHLRRNKGE
ncbi:MAG: undecaprenyl diphosphate synthase family protein [Candidatus Nanohaloarchaea archaeon]